MRFKFRGIICLFIMLIICITSVTDTYALSLMPQDGKEASQNSKSKANMDGTQSSWAANEIQKAHEDGLTYNQIEGNYQKSITREEFCTIVVRLYEKLSTKQAAVSQNPFTDTSNAEILKAVTLGIVKGTSATTFSPDNNITRQEICVMFFRAIKAAYPAIDTTTTGNFQFDDAASISPWALDAVKYIYLQGIMNGTSTTTISPLENTSREQAIALIKRTYEKKSAEKKPADSVDFSGLESIYPSKMLQTPGIGRVVPVGKGDTSKGTVLDIPIGKNITIAAVPKSPSNVSAVLGADNKVTVTWNDNSSDETGFDIGAGDSKGNGGTNHVASNVTSWIDDDDHTPGETYFYTVSAHNDTGYSGWTTEVSVKIPPAVSTKVPTAPSNLKAVFGTDNRIKLAWTDNSLDETGFEVDMSNDTYGGGGSIKVDSNTTNWIDDTLHAQGATYSFAVRAYNKLGSSAWSNRVSVDAPVTTAPSEVPSGVTATLGTDNKITVQWNYHPDIEDGYEIKMRSTKSANITTAKKVADGKDMDKWLDDGAHIPGETYYYSVRAYNKIGNSSYSGEISVKVPLMPESPDAISDKETGFSLLGKGYNIITGSYADPESVKQDKPFLDMERLLKDHRILKMPTNLSKFKYVDGQSMYSYSDSVATSIGISGGYLCFSGSASASFSSSSMTQSNHSYATLRYRASTYGLCIDDNHFKLTDYLDPVFAKDLNTMEPEALFEKYGTHMLRSVIMGGRLDYNVEANSQYTKEQHDFSYDVQASFSTGFASASADFSQSRSQASESFWSNTKRNINSQPLYNGSQVDANNFKQWSSWIINNPSLCDFGDTPFIPIWEFASDKSRQEQLKSRFNVYAQKHDYITVKGITAITGLHMEKVMYHPGAPNGGVLSSIHDPVTGDDWTEIANIEAHNGQDNNELSVLYARTGSSGVDSMPPVTNIFIVNKSKFDDENVFFNKIKDGDPTAKLWGKGANSFAGFGLDKPINCPGNDELYIYYVTSMKKSPITSVRVRYDEDATSHYWPKIEETQGKYNNYIKLLDWSEYLQERSVEQCCNEGLILPCTWCHHFIEYSTDVP